MKPTIVTKPDAPKKSSDADEYRHAYAPTVDGPQMLILDANKRPVRRQIGYRVTR